MIGKTDINWLLNLFELIMGSNSNRLFFINRFVVYSAKTVQTKFIFGNNRINFTKKLLLH